MPAPTRLDDIEARILGVLVEKSLTTPESYPLSFNSLLLGCNQKTSRDPVMELDPDSLGRGVQSLVDKGFIERYQRAGERVPKFTHHIENLVESHDPKVITTIVLLFLRGPQTAGEIKGRSDRMCKFESVAEVEGLLQTLAARAEGPFVARMPRQPGQKENRYVQLFTGDAPPASAAAPVRPSLGAAPVAVDRIAQLEKRVEALEAALSELRGGAKAPVEEAEPAQGSVANPPEL